MSQKKRRASRSMQAAASSVPIDPISTGEWIIGTWINRRVYSSMPVRLASSFGAVLRGHSRAPVTRADGRTRPLLPFLSEAAGTHFNRISGASVGRTGGVAVAQAWSPGAIGSLAEIVPEPHSL